jgi:DNA sulfur modification protein DndD
MTLRNFGVFRGRHEVDFMTSDPGRPVVLIGAMNGSGKTTLLEALKLALYGRRAADLSRGSRSYDDFLLASIHRDVPSADGASIEVVFTLLFGGRGCTYRVVREWSDVNGQVRESVDVSVDGEFEAALSEGWNEHVESILPVRLAPFFLFDGERLETLADPARAREFLGNAIEALLGLDIVDRLGDDLRSVERRIRESAVDAPEDHARLATLQAQVESSDREVRLLMQRRGELTNTLEAARRGLADSKRELEAIAGDLPERSSSLQREQAVLSARRADAASRLMDLAYGDGPLILLRAVIEDALAHAAPESLDPQLLAERDALILATMRKKRFPAEGIARVKEILERDVATRGDVRSTGSGKRSILVDAQQRALAAESVASVCLEAMVSSEVGGARVESLLSALPTEQSVVPLMSAVRDWEVAVATAETEHRVATELLDRARRSRESAESAIQEFYADAMNLAKEQRYTEKLVNRSGELRRTLTEFRVAMAASHASRLGETILEAFQCLHRKNGTIERIDVEASSFEMALFDGDGRRIDPARLSAGERQLLAVAMVWAILKAADRPLPLWIDTPLGRLDSTHRRHLVERFFPFAAPQVVLLSTDTEIDQEARLVLSPYIAKAYRIEFDPSQNASRFAEGYFSERAA